MSRFGVNLIHNLPPTVLTNTSPLLKGLKWPNDREYIACLHSADWMFYLTAWVKKHIVAHSKETFKFSARDQAQALPYMIELMRIFNPITMLSLYHECLAYYQSCIIGELIEFNEKWYLNIVRSYHTLDDWQSDPDWFWRHALRSVVFMPRNGLKTLQNQLPDWNLMPGVSKDSGCPENLLLKRFPSLISRIDNDYFLVSNDIKGQIQKISSSGAWGAAAGGDSPFIHAVSDIDQFFLSLYDPLPGQTFEWSMALDILQSQWSLTDWKYNPFATKNYNMLRYAEKEGIVALNKPITSAHAAAVQSGAVPNQPVSYEPQPFHDLRTKIQLLAADMAFDYCSDHELSLLVTDLDTLVRNPNFPRAARMSYFSVLKHLKSKISLYNMVQAGGVNNEQTQNDELPPE